MSTPSSAKLRILTSVLLLAAAVTAAQPPAPPASMPEPSKDMRQQMATVHEQMAACLRSEQSFAECRRQMQRNCQAMMAAQGCHMVGMGSKHDMVDSPAKEPEHEH